MLEIKNVSKSYDGVKLAIKNLTFDVNDGDIFAFIGHNGAGKTTLIKCICGIYDFDEGEILINGVSIKDNPIEAKKQMAYIPDNPELYESLSPIEFYNFISDAYNVSESDRKERINKYSKLFDMEDKLCDNIGTFSHGMKQKVALISALIHNPKLLILDEPFVGLDPEASFKLKGVMKELANMGTTIFFSTHVLDTAEKICNRVAIIKNGEIVKIGDMSKIKKDESLEEVFMELIDKDDINI